MSVVVAVECVRFSSEMYIFKKECDKNNLHKNAARVVMIILYFLILSAQKRTHSLLIRIAQDGASSSPHSLRFAIMYRAQIYLF